MDYVLGTGQASWSLYPKELQPLDKEPPANNKDHNYYFAWWSFQDGKLTEIGDCFLTKRQLESIKDDPRLQVQARTEIFGHDDKLVTTIDGTLFEALLYLHNHWGEIYG